MTQINADKNMNKITYKIAVVGHQCGKSRLICRFLYNNFSEDDDPTVEDNYVKDKFIVDNEECRLEILDTSGNDCYANLYSKWFNWADAFLLVYNLTSAYSFDCVLHYIERIEKIRKNKKFSMVLVATHLDKESTNREVTTKEGLSVAYRYKCPFFEVSSLNGTNSDKPFIEIIREIRKFLLEEQQLKDQKQQILQKKQKKTDKRLPMEPLENPEKVGNLLIKQTQGTKKNWHKGYMALKESKIYIYDSQKDFQEQRPSSILSLLTTTVKPVMSKDKRNCFEIVGINQTFMIQTETAQEVSEWINGITNKILTTLNSITSSKEMKNAAIKQNDRTPEEEWRLIQKIDQKNCICADCNAEDPDWTSINIGILICIQCSGIHRSLGVHITKIRSLTLDKLDSEVYEFLKYIGNLKANEIWEANLKNITLKPSPKDDRQKKEKFIKAKYISKDFILKNIEEQNNLSKKLYQAIEKNDLFTAISMLNQGANINWVNSEDNNQTPLHKAALEGYLMCAVWLVLNGCELNLQDNHSRTPLDISRIYKKKSVEKWLFKKGANENITSSSSTTEENNNISKESNSSFNNISNDSNVSSPEISKIVSNSINIQNSPTISPKNSSIRSLPPIPTKNSGSSPSLIKNEKNSINVIKNEKKESFTEMITLNEPIENICNYIYNKIPILEGDIQKNEKKSIETYICQNINNSNNFIINSLINYPSYNGIILEEALRKFLSIFNLPNDLGVCDKFMNLWTSKYLADNKQGKLFYCLDPIYILSWHIILLNFNLHINDSIHIIPEYTKKITKSDFIRYNCGINEGKDLPKEYLEKIFDSISYKKLEMEEEELLKLLLKKEYKGWLIKQGGKRKTWKRRWVNVNTDCLTYFKSNNDIKPIGLIQFDGIEIIRTKELDGKKKYTFLLRGKPGVTLKAHKYSNSSYIPGNHTEFLFYSESESEVIQWIDIIETNLKRNEFYSILKNRSPDALRNRTKTAFSVGNSIVSIS